MSRRSTVGLSTLVLAGWRRCRAVLRDDRGSTTVQMAFGLPLLIIALCFAVFCGRLTISRIDVAAAASASARAASLERSPAAAQIAAEESASAALADKGITCAQLAVTVDTSGFAPGSAVTVTIRCSLTTGDLVGLSLPGEVSVDGASTSPVDTWRATVGSVP